MAATVIEVDTSVLRSDVNVIHEELSGIGKDADKLANILSQLESMWDGDAKQAFSTAVRDDVNRLRELVKAMNTLTDRTSEARAEYDKCEGAVGQIVSSIRV